MTVSTFTDIVTMLFCSAVLVQSVRLIRCLRAVKGAGFAEMVAALDTATIQAKRVLADLRETLQIDCAANARVIASGEAMREELTVMAGIADAVAERIVEAVGKSNAKSSRAGAPVAAPAIKQPTPPSAKRARAPRANAPGAAA
ncbi:hypothetical protein GCM10008023_34080 [Sphingomonas glacialis]|uniref:Uncharacterized protein n=1 Tax=Sphingomonas glacialis TaxID=658225 RepID=A0ABQ3LRG5_9SPHN|nr:DUF6468 domain-containing protein [Sphingomonas glacialis]GHH23288.1 hypothetical protein GCM10008023_34080 [Sphingomonas glacialis]